MIVQRFTVNPGQWEGVHAHHPDMLYIHIKGGQWAARSKREGEHAYPAPSPDGEVGWMPTIDLAEGHESGNIGKDPIDLDVGDSEAVAKRGRESHAQTGSEDSAQARSRMARTSSAAPEPPNTAPQPESGSSRVAQKPSATALAMQGSPRHSATRRLASGWQKFA